MPSAVTWPDLVAPLVFLTVWIGYAYWADSGQGFEHSLMARVNGLRGRWMQEMLGRDVRIVDIQVVQVLVHAIAFFASSVVLIIGGGVAMLGARDRAMEVIGQIPFAESSPPVLWETKILLLIVVFVYAFFKFTWALRQFNYVVIMIGAAPPPAQANSPAALVYAARSAGVANRAAEHFNKAMRSYYFGLAALSWFVHPYLLIGTTTMVVLVVYRREFRSRTLANLPSGLAVDELG